MSTQTTTHTEAASQPKLKFQLADLNNNAKIEKFLEPVANDDYARAVDLIKSRLPHMSQIAALFCVNLGPLQPDLLIDSRSTPATLQTAPGPPPTTDAYLSVRPNMVPRFARGEMEARYALNFGHILIHSGSTRIGVKFLDALSPFAARTTHPKLSTLDLSSLPKPTTSVPQVKADLDRWGYGLVADALTPSELSALRTRLSEQAAGEAAATVAFHDGGDTKPNQRIWCLPNKGACFNELLDTNRVIDDFVFDFCGDDAILFSYTANIVRPGNAPMHMHTDQLSIQPPIRDVAVGLNLMYFLEDVSADNGGTYIMPGSHKGEFAPDDPYRHEEVVCAEGKAGTCLVFESRLWHATGRNVRGEGERPVLLAFFVRSWMRQAEQFVLSVRDEVVQGASDRVKGFMGWRCTGLVGGVQGKWKDGAIVRRPVGDEVVGVLGGEDRSLGDGV
ncbi:uncharacterized protein HMPREF1541_10740 [Cyphellophora europaea CBS 101466]|uniref:Uncharacterized protein n=1 Tax=Cyphellophora europaea (strain CBS 101466) TaxID=1220924 RepID=W2S6D6_CYPE1|nr:uncharacterized protein HMPREF1541_10740 [Cyphellophora europaea CBS 101466]ETN44190.1 hypothetical protein HMPREF1541_10740 [Cyphellophora europaea CBS 101466]